MHYCNQCHRITPGEPLFCNFCGRSYNLKLCPHRHPNPRNAEICSQCGSRDLSMPHPRVPLWLAPLLLLLSALPALVLIGVTLLANKRGIWKFAATAKVDDQVAAEADLICAVRPTP